MLLLQSPFTIKLPPAACTKLMRKMRRLTPIHLILAWLLLAASQYVYFTMSVQAEESVHFRLRREQPSSRSNNRDASPSWVQGKKIHKNPSGPNPVGNHRPPFRHK